MAEWIDRTEEPGAGYWECSYCGEPWVLIEGTPAENNMNYCPNCGVKMDREKEKTTKKTYHHEEYDRDYAGGWDCSDEEYNYAGYVRDVLRG